MPVVENTLQIMCQGRDKRKSRGEEWKWKALIDWSTLNLRNQKFKSYATTY